MFLVCVLFGQPAAGQGKRGQQPGGHIRIEEVFVDFNLETITIKGEDFDFGGFLEVTLGEALVGDITSLCTPDFVSIPQTITCDFSVNNGGTGLPPDGDYLLTVATGAGQSQSDEYDLTIGGRRLAGSTCPPGEALVGFDASSQIICAPFVPIPPMPIPTTKLVFVTSTGFTANLGGLAGADDKCNSLAAAAGLPGTYLAWLSDGTNSPDTRFNKSTNPYIRAFDSATVANDYADLTDGALINPIVLDENGTSAGPARVWTNVSPNGTTDSGSHHCFSWRSTSGSIIGLTGTASLPDSRWTKKSAAICAAQFTSRLYCFQQ